MANRVAIRRVSGVAARQKFMRVQQRKCVATDRQGLAGALNADMPMMDMRQVRRPNLAAARRYTIAEMAQRRIAGLICMFTIFVSLRCVGAGRALAQDFGPDKKPQYFPVGVFSAKPRLSDYLASWYAKILRAMREPSLLPSNGVEGRETYRFLWVPSIVGHPIAVRLTVLPDGSGVLFGKKLNGADRSNIGKLALKRSKVISAEAVNQFVQKLQQTDFWDMPTELPVPPNTVQLDGEQWVMEGVRGREYHVVDRWSPHGGAYFDACQELAKLSGI
jgi:hypothetical protein